MYFQPSLGVSDKFGVKPHINNVVETNGLSAIRQIRYNMFQKFHQLTANTTKLGKSREHSKNSTKH